MKIFVTSGIGTGSTKLSAFDNALLNAGVHNYNIIRLSSVIPKGADIVKKDAEESGSPGDKAYMVYAEERTDGSENIAAGLGWYLFDQEKYGIFVEHHYKSKKLSKKQAEEKVLTAIKKSVKDLCKNRGKQFKEKKLNHLIKSFEINNIPSCVFVGALYKIESF